jgi:hypothetical protein
LHCAWKISHATPPSSITIGTAGAISVSATARATLRPHVLQMT